MIQWRIYNVRSPLDAIAARWAVEQEPTGIFPLGNVDLGVPDFDVEIRSGAAKAQTTGAAPPAERHPVLELAPVVDDDAGAFTPEDAYESSDEELVVIRSHG